ncbi:MAG: 16S rRNA (cytosine(1402)-N(4))-methyltransferase RsmH [Elusimicrobia bacterium]|nr:16S rRNA (cytosine(1402)-N(4))-methyltransferase RsmH [Elusimicrobiota bacterium]
MPSLCAAVLLRSGMVLLARRPPGAEEGGRWEFPGGPIARGESPAAAVARVLRDSLGIEAEAGAEAGRARHAGLETVALLVPAFSGEPRPVRHDQLAWVEARRLLDYELTASQLPIAEAVAAHRRRKRYRGTHPRRFAEKYKELGGDPYAMEKAKARGSTPAGAHVPVMLAEVLEALAPLPGAAVLDCTLGWGGHAQELARRVGPEGKVLGLDRDGEELARTVERLGRRGVAIAARQGDFASARRALAALGLGRVDALLADLGVSSMQLDRPERGMSFKNDGPLDMRMDRSRGPTAAEWLAGASEREVADALSRFGDEPDAGRIAAALAARGRPPRTTGELAAVVAAAKGLGPGRFLKRDAFAAHPAARTFQALRIVVNAERESLERLLADLPELLAPGGRAALLTFHSGEERAVAAALRAQTERGLWRAPLPAARRPSPEEVRLNPRARSARLWRAVRTALPV